MDLLTTVVVLLIAVALIGWVAAAIDGRRLEAFGSGFVGYRPYGWPHGCRRKTRSIRADRVARASIDRRRGAGALPRRSSSSSMTPLRRRSRSNVSLT